MRIQKRILVGVVLALLIPGPFQALYADQCDDMFQKAFEKYDAGQKALSQKKYDRAVWYYNQAAEAYDEVAKMKKCRCGKIKKTSLNNAALAREMVEKSRNYEKERDARDHLLDEFDEAEAQFKMGNDYANNKEWDKAIEAFEEAAWKWERLAKSFQDNNSQICAKNAKLARKEAERVRREQ